MKATPTVVIQEKEEESVHNGDENATPERDSETRMAWVSPARSKAPELPPSGLEPMNSDFLGVGPQVAPESYRRGERECARDGKWHRT